METIGYGLIQIPIVTKYKVCCITRSLAGGVTSTGWQEIVSAWIYQHRISYLHRIIQVEFNEHIHSWFFIMKYEVFVTTKRHLSIIWKRYA